VMAIKNKISDVLKNYDQNNIRIASLGGHSALDVCSGAKAEGFESIVVAEKGRENTYAKYYKTRGDKGCIDHIILVDKFADITKPEVQEKLRKLNAVFVHSRYFWVYCDYEQIENNFLVPIFGNRILVRKEERTEDKNQYFLLSKAGIKIPKQFSNPEDIDRLVLVKTAEAMRAYERAFFLVGSYGEYQKKSKELIAKKIITADSLKEAVIEEFVVGPQLNLNFFYSPLDGELELLGTDTRRQTNLDGLLRLTAPEQIEALKYVSPKYIENGHIAVTIKESLLEKAYVAGENFVKAVAEHYPPGMIGPFALQGAITAGPPKEELVVFDVSMRIPGSPGIMFTPYTNYMYGESLGVGRRIAKEIQKSQQEGQLATLLT
jgi:5-formaminoimidazole-4-carboxamide-1-(beta)-D-ribofuranosyl 5'-monophosphate synthetase